MDVHQLQNISRIKTHFAKLYSPNTDHNQKQNKQHPTTKLSTINQPNNGKPNNKQQSTTEKWRRYWAGHYHPFGTREEVPQASTAMIAKCLLNKKIILQNCIHQT